MQGVIREFSLGCARFQIPFRHPSMNVRKSREMRGSGVREKGLEIPVWEFWAYR